MLQANDNAAFDAQVVEASQKRPVVVILTAEWCGPCKMLKPKLVELSEQHGFPLVAVDAGGAGREIAGRLMARAVPTVVVFDKGVEVTRFAGNLAASDIATALMKVRVF